MISSVKTMNEYIYKNNQLICVNENETAGLASLYPLYRYGFGIYTTMNYNNGSIYSFSKHMERLNRDLSRLNLQKVSRETILNILQESLEKEGMINKQAIVRISVFPEHFNMFDVQGIPNEELVFLVSFRDPSLKLTSPKILTVNVQRSNAEIKAINYVSSIICKYTAVSNGCDEGLMTSSEGYILECSFSNIFFIRQDDVIETPSLDSGILPGITRESVLDIFSHDHRTVHERKIHKDELGSYKSAFITNTSAFITPITSINDIQYDVQPAQQMADQYRPIYVDRYLEKVI